MIRFIQFSFAKVLTGFAILLSSTLCFSQNSGHGLSESLWMPTYEDAKLQAEQEDKPILIFFTGSDWCYPCKLLTKDFFSTERFNAIATENFVLYEADFPRAKGLVSKSKQKVNRKLQNRYDVGVYPTVVIVTSRGKRLSHITGYSSARDTQYHYNALKRALDKTKDSK